GADAKQRLQHQKERPRSPGLGRARDRILYRVVVLAALHATEQLRQAVLAEGERCLIHGGGRLQRGFAQPIQAESVDDERIVVRPHRSAVVAERVEHWFARSERTPTPSGEQIALSEALGHLSRALAPKDTSEKEVPHVGRRDVQWLLVRVESHGVVPALG